MYVFTFTHICTHELRIIHNSYSNHNDSINDNNNDNNNNTKNNGYIISYTVKNYITYHNIKHNQSLTHIQNIVIATIRHNNI